MRERYQNDKNLSLEQAAKYLGLSPQFLKELGTHADGPVYSLYKGEIRYKLSDVLEWQMQNEHMRSII